MIKVIYRTGDSKYNKSFICMYMTNSKIKTKEKEKLNVRDTETSSDCFPHENNYSLGQYRSRHLHYIKRKIAKIKNNF